MKKRREAFDVKRKVMPGLLALGLLMTIFPVAAFATAGKSTGGQVTRPLRKLPFISTNSMAQMKMTA